MLGSWLGLDHRTRASLKQSVSSQFVSSLLCQHHLPLPTFFLYFLFLPSSLFLSVLCFLFLIETHHVCCCGLPLRLYVLVCECGFKTELTGMDFTAHTCWLWNKIEEDSEHF